MSAMRSTVMVNSRVFYGKTKRASQFPFGSCCQFTKCCVGVTLSETLSIRGRNHFCLCISEPIEPPPNRSQNLDDSPVNIASVRGLRRADCAFEPGDDGAYRVVL